MTSAPPPPAASMLAPLLPYILGLVVTVVGGVLILYILRRSRSRQKRNRPSGLPFFAEQDASSKTTADPSGGRRTVHWLRCITFLENKRSPTSSAPEKHAVVESTFEKSGEVDLEASMAASKPGERSAVQSDAGESSPRRGDAAANAHCPPTASTAALDPQNIWVNGHSPLAIFLPSLRIF